MSRATAELQLAGVDCAECAARVEAAIRGLPGVDRVHVLAGAERATVTYDPAAVDAAAIERAVSRAGFQVTAPAAPAPCDAPCTGCASCTVEGDPGGGARRLPDVIGWGLLILVAAAVVANEVGERLGLWSSLAARIPWPVAVAALLVGGWPVFRGVVRAALARRVTSHTLMTLGVVAAVAIGEMDTAAVVVFFMRFADWIEALTAARSRQALRQLVALAPQTARVLRDGREVAVPVGELRPGDVVVVRPGERIPADGEVVEGRAPVDQASITGESVPVDKMPGDVVFAATIAQAGWLRVRVARVGGDTTFGRIVRLVEEAEGRKAPVQKFADRFSAYYLPFVLAAALGTLLVGHSTNAAVAVLVVTCSCAIAIATPVAVLAAVGYGARRGILVKGGIVLEQLARVDTVVFDKTGTLTLGRPRLTHVESLDGISESEALEAAAALERRSEHPISRAIVEEAGRRGLTADEPDTFDALPGRGVAGRWHGREWALGNRRLLTERGTQLPGAAEARLAALEGEGNTVFTLVRDGAPVALVGVADVPREDAAEAIERLRRIGIRHLIVLTGDNERVAASVAGALGLEFRANLLPEDKIAAVRQLQAEGRTVLMVGDGVNDGPALMEADVGVAMGAAGSDVAIEAADVALMRDDLRLVSEAVLLGRRTAGTIRQNLGFTAVYNLAGIALAAVGLLPPIWAAAAQSLPDVGIVANSARLLHRRG